MSSHYTVGGMPLAFTQEDFLVYISNGTKNPGCSLAKVHVVLCVMSLPLVM